MADTDEQYKNLQRQLQLEKDKNKQLTLENLGVAQRDVKLDRIEQMVEAVTRKLGESDSDYTELADSLTEARKDSEVEANFQNEIVQELSNHDTNWDDPLLKEANELWADGKASEAVASVRRSLSGRTVDDVDALATAKAQEILREKYGLQVDVGETVNSANSRRTWGEVKPIDPRTQTVEEMSDQTDKVLDEYFSKK